MRRITWIVGHLKADDIVVTAGMPLAARNLLSELRELGENTGFHPEAEAEFLDAIDYYEECEPGLVYDFAIEVHGSIKSILSFPKAWAILEDDIRRCQTRPIRIAGIFPSAAYLQMVIWWSLRYSATSLVVIIWGIY